MLATLIGDERSLGWVLRFWPVLVVAFVGALAATWLCKWIALRFGIVDRPDDCVKTHSEPVPYLGGLGLLGGLGVGILTGIAICRMDGAFSCEWPWLLGVLAGGAVACSVGLADDLRDLRPWQKLLGQFLVAMVLLLMGISPDVQRLVEPFGGSISPRIEMVLDTLIVTGFVLGATNSLNLLDGLDGLCAGVTAIISAALLLLAVHLATWGFSDAGDSVRIVLGLSLVGSLGGFLPFNRHPARIFMGDAGTMLLGAVIAALMILFVEGTARWGLASIVVFGLPILETGVTILRRLKHRRSILISDRGHLYARMIDRGLPLRTTVGLCYGLAGLYALIGLIMSQMRTRQVLLVLLVVFIGSGLIVWRTGHFDREEPDVAGPSSRRPDDR